MHHPSLPTGSGTVWDGGSTQELTQESTRFPARFDAGTYPAGDLMNYVPPSASDQQLNGSPPRDPHFRMGRRQGQLSTEFAECRPSRPCAWSGGAIVDARRFCEDVSGLGDSMFNLGVGGWDSDEWRTERVVLQERAACMTRVRTGVETGMRGGRCCLRQVREDRTVNVRIRTSRNVLPALWIADRWVHENQIVRLRWRQCRSLGLAMISLSLSTVRR